MVNIRFFARFLVACSLGGIAGCPAVSYLNIRNDASADAAVIARYSPRVIGELAKGGEESVAINPECLRIRYQGEVYEYGAFPRNNKYIKAGISSVSMYAVFTSDLDVAIYSDQARTEDKYILKRGACK